MQRRRVFVAIVCTLSALLWAACGGEEIKPDSAPILGVLELPIAHRFGGSEPPNAARVEVSPSEIRVDGETLIKLENGKVPAAEQSGHTLPKLKAKLAGKSALAVSTHAATPYATLARVLNTGLEASARTFAFKVRKPGSNTETGWLTVSANQFTKSSEDAAFGEEQLVPWDSFVAVWEDAITACQGGERGDCGFRPAAKAQGGKLDMMLRVRGTGLAIRMRQTGAPPPAAPEPTKKPKVEMMEGLAAQPTAAEEEALAPSTEHVFTLRADQATATPSPVSGIVKPVCSAQTCAVVVDAEGISMSGRVLSLLGAAFPDGTPEPQLAWVLPP
jgi:hypothetical protein